MKLAQPRARVGFPWERREDREGNDWACRLRVFGHRYDTRDGYHFGVFVSEVNPGEWKLSVAGSVRKEVYTDLDEAIAAAELELVSAVRAKIRKVKAEVRDYVELLESIGCQDPEADL